LRVQSGSDSIEWVLELMRTHHLPPAEVIANPNALHELFVQALAGGNGVGPALAAAPSRNTPDDRSGMPASGSPTSNHGNRA
jgi:hypothetical protein